MTNRSKHLTFYTFLIGMLIVSFGFNCVFYSRIMILQDFIKGVNPWVTVEQYDLMKKEIDRLDKERYQIVPQNTGE